MKHRLFCTKINAVSNALVTGLITGFIIFTLFGCGQVEKGRWATFRHDNKRSGATTERVAPPLSLRWVYYPQHAPKPAWYKPAEELPRAQSDDVFHVTAANGSVYFASSADDQVYALDMATGQLRWRFFAAGPVRFAPTVWHGRVYVCSDDGYVYCLNGKNGKLVWKYRAGPNDEKVLGNGRMISSWPVRTNILIEDDIAYFAAGVFPYEGLYLCALRADNGKIVWKNSSLGDHVYDLQFGGLSPQGYLLASDSILYVPSGRAMPAAFDRYSGQFLYAMSPGSKVGGTWALVTDDELIAGVDRSGTPAKVKYDAKTGKREGDAFASFHGIDLVLTPEIAYTLTEKGIFAVERKSYLKINKKISEINKKQNKLHGLILDLDRKLVEPQPQNKNSLKKQLRKTTAELDNLNGEEKRLQNSLCRWQYSGVDFHSLILADSVIFAGGKGRVIALDTETGENLWQANVTGTALGLAAVNRHLFVSTENGQIFCFSEDTLSKALTVASGIDMSPYSEDKNAAIIKKAVDEILQDNGVNKGYALVTDCETGQLALELAKRTKLKIIGITNDARKMKLAREKLSAAGLYGSRIIIEKWQIGDLPDYFANLIVSEKMTIAGKMDCKPEEIFRVLKPYGGVAYFGQPGEKGKKVDLSALRQRFETHGSSETELTEENGWLKLARGKLVKAGSWTSQYGNPQNTCCSDDELVKFPLGVLWYGEPGPAGVVDRHARATSPVAMDGRLFVEGENLIRAFDSYNGTQLWKREIPGAVRVRVDVDGGNWIISEKGLFVAIGAKCLRLDPASGKTLQVYNLPPTSPGKRRRWGYIACVGNTLFGSSAMPLLQEYNEIWQDLVKNDSTWKSKEELPEKYAVVYDSYIAKYPTPNEKALAAFQRDGTKWHFIANFPAWSGGIDGPVPPTNGMMVSDALFAIDIATGKMKWVHHGRKIAHIAISMGDGALYFAESSVNGKQRETALQNKRQLIGSGKWVPTEPKVKSRDADVRLVTALQAETGKILWQKPVDLTGCGGDAVTSAYHDKLLLFFGSFGLHDKWRYPAGQLKWHRITALSAGSGDIVWSRPLNYMVRPVIIDSTIIVEPHACDLYTGKIKMRSHPVTGEKRPWEYYRPGHTCAITSANKNGLFYRSYCTAFYDLQKDEGLTYFGAVRPGCWINMIPANGLLLAPEASSGCTCSFPIRSTVVFVPKNPQREVNWNVFIANGSMTPVKHLAINLGAPGDRKDDNGTVWFGYPRPTGKYGVKLKLKEKIIDGMGYFTTDVRNSGVSNSNSPWLLTSGCLGLVKCTLPLIADSSDEKTGVFTVRLGFTAPQGDKLNQRVFSVKVQGDEKLKHFDIFKEAGAAQKAVVKEFKGIEVENNLTIEMVPETPNPEITRAPVLNFIEVVREDN